MASVKDIMTKDVVKISPDKTVLEAAEIMDSKTLGCLIITQNDEPVGIVTERDIVRRIVAKKLPYTVQVSEIMSKNLVVAEQDSSLKEAARLMSSHKIRRLPVVKEGKLVGIVVASDFVRNAGKKSTTEEILEAMGRYSSNTSPI
ncbi:MAG: CBS domain-containing protein [Candidatus Bathyarchaeota archaeon]|nr:CBS domain-containing protein [Candidatus Bathyarchaeota archaeon]